MIGFQFLLPLWFTTLLLGSIQSRLLYYPERQSLSTMEDQAAHLKLEPWPSAESYRGFIASPPAADRSGTWVMLHGNAGSASDRIYYRDLLRASGLRIMILEYPGYGARPGSPSEAVLIADAADSLRRIHRTFGSPIFVLGESLGAAVAAGAVAGAGVPVQGMVLCTPWDRLASVAESLYWFLPSRLLLRDGYDSAQYLTSYAGPLAVIAAAQDELIPAAAPQRLFAGYTGRKRYWELPGGHNTWLNTAGRAFWSDLSAFLEYQPNGPSAH